MGTGMATAGELSPIRQLPKPADLTVVAKTNRTAVKMRNVLKIPEGFLAGGGTRGELVKSSASGRNRYA